MHRVLGTHDSIAEWESDIISSSYVENQSRSFAVMEGFSIHYFFSVLPLHSYV